MDLVRSHVTPKYVLAAAAALTFQLGGTLDIIVREVINVRQTYAETGYARNPSGGTVLLALIVLPLLLSLMTGLIRTRVVRVISVCLLAIGVLCNAFFLVFVRSAANDSSRLLINEGKLDIYNVEFIHLDYWKGWFFLSSCLVFVAMVLGINQLRSGQLSADNDSP
jgi:hypothetical protein